MLRNYVFIAVLVLTVVVSSLQFSNKPEAAPHEFGGLEQNLEGIRQVLLPNASVKFMNTTNESVIPSQIAYLLVPIVLLPRVHPSPADTVLCIYPHGKAPGMDTTNFNAIWRRDYDRCGLALYIPNKAG